MVQLEFDENLGRQLEVMYATRDIRRRRRLVHEALGTTPSQRVLDVGCGPGFYAAELLEQVGAEGSVVGVDESDAMLALAAQRCHGSANAAFHRGDATSLPVEDADFDQALCVQVLEYVADVDAGLREMHRALRPGGRLVVWDVDWSTVSWHSRDPDRMDRVLRAWDQHLAHPALTRTLAARLRHAGFEEVELHEHAFATLDLTPDAYGGGLVAVVQHYVGGAGLIGEDELSAWAGEQRDLGEAGEFYFACVQCCFTGFRRA